jgi:hypothetical protein
LRAFVEQVNESIHTGKQQMQVWSQLVIGQVIKTPKKHRLVSVKHTLLRGDEQRLEQCLEQSRGGSQINTAFIERLNGTVGERLASLTRKCRHASQRLEALQWGMYLIGCTYNFCWPHQELSKKEHAGYAGTPAMASGLTTHIWSLQELLTYKVPPQVLLKAREAERRYLVRSPDALDTPKRKGRASKYYLILLQLREEKARSPQHAL